MIIWPASITFAFLLFIPVSPNNEALAGNNTLAIRILVVVVVGVVVVLVVVEECSHI